MKRKVLFFGLLVGLFLLCACSNKEEQMETIVATPKITQETMVTKALEDASIPTGIPASSKKELLKTTATPIPAYHPFDGDSSNYVYFYKDGRNKAWEEDIIYLANKFANRHPILVDVEYEKKITWEKNNDRNDKSSAYDEGVRNVFLQQVNDLIPKVAELDDVEIIYELRKIVALLKDGHSFIDYACEEVFPIYYIPLMSEGEYKLYVNIVPKKYEEIMFCYLESINGVSIKEIMELASPYISADSKEWIIRSVANTKYSMAIMNKDILRIIGVVKEDDISAEFCFVAEDGTKQNIIVEAAGMVNINEMTFGTMKSKPEVIMYQNANKKYWYTKLEKNDVLYVKFNQCSEDRTMPNEKFMKELVEEIKILPENAKIIFDFRENGGGNIEFMNFKFLIDEVNKREDMTLYIFTNINSYSAGVVIPYLLRQELTNSIIIGEPAGQMPNTYGNPNEYYLPNSKLSVWMTDHYLEAAPGYEYDTLQPDKIIYQTLEDYKNGIDTVLEEILTMN